MISSVRAQPTTPPLPQTTPSPTSTTASSARPAVPDPAAAARSRSDAARARFTRIEQANVAVESGGLFVPSRLATTAGAPASLGRAQLLVRLQVDELERLPDATLTGLGIDRDLLASLDRRGQAALDYYDFLVRGEVRPSLPLDREARAEASALVRAGDYDTLVARFGARFEAETGIPAAELAMLARTRDLAHARAEARAHGADRALASPRLEPLRERLGDALERYVTRGNVAENRNGWYTRAAMSDAAGWTRFETALREGGDAITSRRRHMRNFRAAEDVIARVGGADGLSEAAHTRLVGQLARLAHASPAAFQSLFGPGAGVRSVADVRARLDALVRTEEGPGAASQLGRALRRFTHALESRDGVRG